jgi:hypothetical protein
MSNLNNEIDKAKNYVLNLIRDSDYPIGHPFLEDSFKDDYVCIILSLIRYYLIENDMINDFIKKLKSNCRAVQ